MKIVNICISNPYIEGYAYQENILPDYFINAGIETSIIGANVFPKHFKKKRIKKGTYYEKNKKIIRINCLKIAGEFIIPFGLMNQLFNEKPDVILHHNINSTSLIICSIYCILNKKATFLVDNHVDYINRSKNKIWQLIYYKILLKFSVKISSYLVHKYYGVTLLRCDYLHEFYGIPKSKIDFLPIGADVFAADKILETKSELRGKFELPENSFIFISGGKMGKNKGTNRLIKAIDELNNKHENIFLVLFGSFHDIETQELANQSKNTIFKGWCTHETSLMLLKMADVAVWPVHHTTLIEDAISVNTPLLIRKTRTTEHLIDGNGIFLETEEFHELLEAMNYFLENHPSNDFVIKCKTMREKLNYDLISKKIITDVALLQTEK